MFMLAYNPSNLIDYVLPEMLGISFEHIDNKRNIEFICNSYFDVFINMLDYENYQTPSYNNALHYGEYIMEKRSLEELHYTSEAGKMSPGKYINEFKKQAKVNK